MKTNPSTSSDRKRTLSSGNKNEDDHVDENISTNKKATSIEKANEVEVDSNCPASKKSRLDDNQVPASRTDDSFEDSIGNKIYKEKVPNWTVNFMFYIENENVILSLYFSNFQKQQVAAGVEYLLDNILIKL